MTESRRANTDAIRNLMEWRSRLPVTQEHHRTGLRSKGNAHRPQGSFVLLFRKGFDLYSGKPTFALVLKSDPHFLLTVLVIIRYLVSQDPWSKNEAPKKIHSPSTPDLPPHKQHSWPSHSQIYTEHSRYVSRSATSKGQERQTLAFLDLVGSVDG